MKNRAQYLLACIFAFLLFLLPGTAFAFQVPAPNGAVTDTSGTLSAEDDTVLESNIASYRASTGNEIGVLVIDSLHGETIEDVAYKTFNEWGVGKKGLDNGVLLVIAMKEHRSRIETGKGIGHVLPDVTAAHILSDVLAPHMRKHDVRGGILATVIAIENELGGSTVPRSTAPSHAPKSSVDGGVVVFMVLFFGLIGFALLTVFRRVAGRAMGDSYSSSDSSSSYYSSSGSSDSGSGGGSFGGGDSGGGGASGSW